MKRLLGGGWSEWRLPLGLTLAALVLPVAVGHNLRTTPEEAKFLSEVLYFCVFLGSAAGLLLIHPAWLDVKTAWNRNSIVAGTALAAGILGMIAYWSP